MTGKPDDRVSPRLTPITKRNIMTSALLERLAEPVTETGARAKQATLVTPELVTAVEVPAQDPSTGSALVEYARRHGDFALGGAAVTLKLGPDGRCEQVTIALLSAGPAPVRAEVAERQLRSSKIDEASIRAASTEAVKGLHPTSDIHGSTEYRTVLLQTMTERALTRAAQRARGSKG